MYFIIIQVTLKKGKCMGWAHFVLLMVLYILDDGLIIVGMVRVSLNINMVMYMMVCGKMINSMVAELLQWVVV